MSDKPVLGAGAYLLAGAALAAIRLGAWLTFEAGPWLAGLYDGWHFLATGILFAVSAGVGEQIFRRRPALGWSALFGGCVALGSIFLSDDFGGFAARQTAVPTGVAYWALVLLVSGLVPLGAWVGGHLERAVLRSAATALCVAAVVANGLLLKSDYRGLHLFVGLVSLSALGATWSRLPSGLFSTTRRKFTWLVPSLAIALGAALVRPPAHASVALSNSTGAALTTLFSRFLTPGGTDYDQWQGDQWYLSRDQLPAIEPSEDNPIEGAPIVVLITVDALRADVIESGKHDRLLPTFARLRDEGLYFTQARSPGTLTKNALASVFMGIHFSQQFWSPMPKLRNVVTVHADETTRFPQHLKDAGVTTANFRAVSWVRNGVILKGFKLDRYIAYPKEESYYAPSPPLFDELLPHVEKMLERQKRPAFIYAHLADPHEPYDQGHLKVGPPFKRYLSEVALVDSQLARLIDLLKKSSSRNRILLILSADHGEAFGEHNSKTHGTTMYDEALRVPLIMWRPHALEPQRINTLVSLIDLGPTILDAFGVSTPGHMMGQSLLPYLSGDAPQLSRPILAETRLMRTIITQDRLKLIVDTRSHQRELYDLNLDPGEKNNLADNAELLQKPLSQLETFFQIHTLRRDGYTPPFVK